MVWQVFKDVLLFRRMIIPLLIHILFWLSLIGGIIVFFYALSEGENGRAFLALLAIIGYRLLLEVLMVVFRINESLTSVRNRIATPLPRIVELGAGGAALAVPAASPVMPPAAAAAVPGPGASTAQETQRPNELGRTYCTECGHANAAENRFCESCGTALAGY